MRSNELFEQFLNYCEEFEIILGNIVIEDEENIFKVFKPSKENEKNYVIFESIIGKNRDVGYATEIDELIEAARDTVGEKIKNNYNPYNPYLL